MTDSPGTVLMVGLPQSGKTTYLAALWHAVREPDGKASVTLERIPDEVEYFNDLLDSWLRCNESAHTSTSTIRTPELTLRAKSGGLASVVFPDYSGEFVRDAWSKRRWPGSLASLIRSARVVLLLIHPSYLHDRVTLDEANLNADAIDAGPPDPDRESIPFDLDAVPSQTQLVDVLQFAVSRATAKRLPVAVLVSAWDEVLGYEKPSDWLAERVPLLHQFLASNSDTMPTAVFGVSAQGANWTTDRDAALGVGASERSWVVTPAGARLADIAAPLDWAMTTAGL